MIGLPLYGANAAETIKIGVAGPFSGPHSSFGDQMWAGATQAAADINQAGGINGKLIEIVKGDDACEPKQAVSVANRLINDEQVTAVVGHFCSSSTIPASTIYADAQVLMITPSATNPLITERGYETIFRTCGRDDAQGYVAAEFIKNVLKANNVVVLHDSDTYGKGLADATRAQLIKLGAKVVLYEGITRGEKDFNALVTKIKELAPDAVYFGAMHPEVGPFLRQLRAQGNKMPLISGDGIVSEAFVTDAGGKEMVNGVYMTFSADPRGSTSAQHVVETFRKKQFEPEGYTLYTYATMQVIAKAIQETSSMDGLALAQWLHLHPVQTIMGEKAWDKKGDLTKATYVIYQWNNQGKYAPLKK